MAGTKNKRRRVFKKKFLLSSKKCWIIEDKLLPVYSHLVDTYSEQLKDTWTVKVDIKQEESQFGSVQIKEELAIEIDNNDAPMILPMDEATLCTEVYTPFLPIAFSFRSQNESQTSNRSKKLLPLLII